ncbi:PLDc_N domain-containing protein [Bacillus sp. S35]|uniref:permease prefix domain 1-containing protein n=1 Tax=Priestia aryabhattai TaxID=412384 RepID=UPI00190DE6DD|nr:permease prefix domain 1-containing protein [Priestia aryabhattai]MBK0009932.1 PLDc_N domain-containing protein [Bacillus sp. S35]MCM3644593.1 PLD nuclease N-terminal domain-containing protein [Priestia aryabhattai]
MKRIEEFVDSMYLNVDGDKQEINELKAEMKNHLFESVQELKEEGKIEQQAITIAIQRFGEEKEMRAAIGQLFEIQKIFAKRVLYIAIVCLILTISMGSFLWEIDDSTAQGLSETSTLISEELENKDVMTFSMKRKIETLVEDTNYISEVTIYNSKDIRSVSQNSGEYHWKSQNPDFQYQRTIWAPKWLGVDSSTSGNGNEQWFVLIESRSFDQLQVILIFMGGAIYWTLFTIWAIINAHHQKRLHIKWILVFLLLNILGYLIYYFTGIQRSSSEEQQKLY